MRDMSPERRLLLLLTMRLPLLLLLLPLPDWLGCAYLAAASRQARAAMTGGIGRRRGGGGAQ